MLYLVITGFLQATRSKKKNMEDRSEKIDSIRIQLFKDFEIYRSIYRLLTENVRKKYEKLFHRPITKVASLTILN